MNQLSLLMNQLSLLRILGARSYARGVGGKGNYVPRHIENVNMKSLEHFKTSIKPKNYAGAVGAGEDGNIPFPLNPYFKVVRPLSEETRMSIFKLFKESPSKWTPRALAEQFGISIVRVEAILRLKSLESNNNEKGIASQSNYVKGMESMLDPVTIRYCEGNNIPQQYQYEPIRENLVQSMNPFTQLLDEEDHLTPEDAAQILNLEPYENIHKRLSVKANRIFQDKAPTSPPAKPIAQDATTGGKNEFMIVDTSKPKTPKIMIRDREGKLLPATLAQVYLKRNTKPKNFSM